MSTDLKRKYGLTIDEYNAMLEKQEKSCAICGGVDPKKRLAVDHNHKTNEIRGLLCSHCNMGLGHFKDDLTLLAKAIQYLGEFA